MTSIQDIPVATIAAITALTAIGWTVMRNKRETPLDKIPGERGMPIVGILNPTVVTTIHWTLEAQKKHGDIFVSKIFGRETVNVCDPDISFLVLRDSEHFEDRPADGFAAFLPRGLLGLPYGDEWKHHRKSLSPLFSEKYLKSYSLEMVPLIQKMCSQWETKINNVNSNGSNKENENGNLLIDIHEQMINVTFDIIGRTGFGTEFNALTGEAHSYEKAGKDILHSILLRSVSSDSLWNLFFKKFQTSAEKAKEVLMGACNFAREGSDKKEERSMISVILNDESLGEKEIYDEMITLLLAGHETTGNTVTFACYLLAKHPEIQKKVQEEIDSVYSMESFSEENINEFIKNNSFPFIKCIIYESLRLFPTVPFVPRESSKDVYFKNYLIPKGTKVGIQARAINYGPQWENAEDFQPERFLNIENEGTYFKEKGFAPFGAGPRVCIGQRFAQMEAAILIAMIFKRFSLSLSPANDHKCIQQLKTFSTITQSPVGGLPLFVSLRS